MAKLSLNEAALTGFTDVYTATYTDLQAIGNGGQKVIATIPAGGAVACVGVFEKVAFAGTSTLVIDVGTTSADPDEFINALDVDAMTLPVFNTGDLMVQSAGTTTFLGGFLPVKPVSTATDILLEVTDANIASATAGELVIAIKILDFSQFTAQ